MLSQMKISIASSEWQQLPGMYVQVFQITNYLVFWTGDTKEWICML